MSPTTFLGNPRKDDDWSNFSVVVTSVSWNITRGKKKGNDKYVGCWHSRNYSLNCLF